MIGLYMMLGTILKKVLPDLKPLSSRLGRVYCLSTELSVF